MSNPWLRFLIGTPRRFVVTMLVLAFLLVTNLFAALLSSLINALMIPLIVIVSLLLVMRFAFGQRRGNGG